MSNSKIYLQIDYSSGNLYETSKVVKEGFEPHTSSTGKTTFRKYYPSGYEGVLDSVSVRDSDFGKQISIAFAEGAYISVGLANDKGNISTFAESVIKHLHLLNKGATVKVYPYNFKPEDSDFKRVGISFSVEGEKVKGLTNAFINSKTGEVKEGDIPAVVWKVDGLGRNRPTAASLEAKNDYLTDILVKEAKRLVWTPTPKPKFGEELPF